MQLVLEVDVLVLEELQGRVLDVVDAEEDAPLVQLLLQQEGPVQRLVILRHAHEGVLQRDVLRLGEGLLHLDELVLAHHQHVAQVAHLRRRVALRERAADLDVVQLLAPLLQVLHLKIRPWSLKLPAPRSACSSGSCRRPPS